jgi:thymidylate synthase (FAD)
MNGTIRSWLHYVDLRSGPETQLEHRSVALGVKDLLKEELPDVFEAMW